MSEISTRINTPSVHRLQAIRNSLRFVTDPISVLDKQLQEMGPTFFTYIGGVYKGLLTTEPELIQHVLQKHHRIYRRSPMHFDKLSHFLGHGLLTSEGDYWLRQRRLIQPGFHRLRLAALTDIMQGVIDQFLDQFDRELERNNNTIDLYPKMMELAFHIVARSLFSANIKEEELQRLSSIITTLQEFIIRQIRQPYLNWWFNMSGQLQRHEMLAREFDEIVLGIIHKRRLREEIHDDLLQMLLDSRYEDTGEGMTDRQLLEESAILFVAGHETTANALSWTWHLLSQHPEIAAKARAEIDRVLGGRKPAFEDLPQLEYITQIIEESMRLYPPAWITDRIATEDDEFEGLHIPKGVVVVTYFYGVHRSEHLWQNPHQFDPDRFSKHNKKMHTPYAYLPFGGGPRLCIGNNFAIMEMQLVLTAMLQRYDFTPAPDHLVTPQALITLRPRYGVRMGVKAR